MGRLQRGPALLWHRSNQSLHLVPALISSEQHLLSAERLMQGPHGNKIKMLQVKFFQGEGLRGGLGMCPPPNSWQTTWLRGPPQAARTPP